MIHELSFYNLINQYILEIPIIQRDYAQGRKLANVTYIREKFVKELARALVQREPVHLGFVYGKIEGRERAKNARLHQQAVETLLGTVKQYANQFSIDVQTSISAQSLVEANTLRFVPLDGQQRLTTLFLLFWYIHMRQGQNIQAPWLANFKYNNRKAALAFFQALSNPDFIKTVYAGLMPDLEEQIRGYTWYLSKWDYDATTSGALTMLQAIHSEFADYPDLDFGSIVLSEVGFRFDFLDLDELRQSDNLYIKMNERGKQLTDFEHFKAWLQDYASQHFTNPEQQDFLKEFWIKLDTVWLDFFWQHIDADYANLDDFFFNFLKTIAITHQFATWPEKELPEFLKNLLQQIRNEAYDPTKVKYIPISKFVRKPKKEEEAVLFELFSFEAMEFIAHSFDSMLRLNMESDLPSAIDSVIGRPFAARSISDFLLKKDSFTINLWDHVMLFAVLFYLKRSGPVDPGHFADWLRITRNLIYNTYVQNPENLYNALQSIAKLTQNHFDNEKPLSWQILQSGFELRFFNQVQLKEEQLKAGLTADPAWKYEIEKLEKHAYFYGQVGFVFKLAEQKTGQNPLKVGQSSMEVFSSYADILSTLFISDTPDFRLQRALLAQGDYLVQTGSNHTFCKTETDSLRSRNENWRRVFADGQKLALLGSLVRALEERQKLGVVDGLVAVIAEHPYTTKDWEFYFVTDHSTIRNCRNLEIRWFSGDNVRLLQGSAITGYHLELRTIALFSSIKAKLRQRAPFKVLDYVWDKNTSGRPGIALQGFALDGKTYNLDIRYDFGRSGYYFLDLWETSRPQKIIAGDVALLLGQLGFAENQEIGTLWLAVEHAQIIGILAKINMELGKLVHQQPALAARQDNRL